MMEGPKMGQPKNEGLNESKESNPDSRKLVLDTQFLQQSGVEVLQNLDINEKNAELLDKMAQIEQELKNRQQVLRVDPDTGEQKFGKDSEFDVLKKKTIEETKEYLTKSSKYVKGAVIAGVAAAFFNYAPNTLDYYPTSSEMLTAIMKEPKLIKELYQELHHFTRDLSDANHVLTGLSVPAFIASTAFAIKNSVRAISQEIKTRVVSNKKVQRMVAMMATGMHEEDAHNVVFVETHPNFGPNSRAMNDLDKKEIIPDNEVPFTGSSSLDINDPYRLSIENQPKEKFVSVGDIRNKLEEMGIKRISREQYKDPKTKLSQ